MELYKQLPYDIQLHIYDFYQIQKLKDKKINWKKKQFIKILSCMYKVQLHYETDDVSTLMQKCNTLVFKEQHTYSKYWTVFDWILWNYIVNIKVNKCKCLREESWKHLPYNIYVNVKIWNYPYYKM